MEKVLYLDFGNSLIKGKYKSRIYRFSYDNDIDLKEFLINYKIEKVYFINTNLNREIFIKEICQLLKIKIREIKTRDILGYLTLNSKITYSQLGVDLALMWFYAKQKNIHDTLIVSYGTWTTFLNIQNQELLGVGILPGINATHKLMFNKNDDQSFFHLKGNNNNQVFGYGNYLFLEGLISLSIAKQQLLILTGGCSQEIYKKIENTNYLYLKELPLLSLELFINFEDNLNNK